MKMIKTSISLQELRRRIYFKSKEEKSHRFWGLYVHVCKYETLEEAYLQTKRNNGSTGIDNISFADIESMGREKYLKEIREELISGTYRPSRNRKQQIPKSNGKYRELGIPTIKDRIVQGALKLILEVIFEADFCEGSYGYRPKRTAHDALNKLSKAIVSGKRKIIDLDLSSYFDTVNHCILLNKISSRISDDKIMHLIKQILKASGKEGVPQGGVISPLFANLYLNDVDKMLEKAKEVTMAKGKYTEIEYVRFADDIAIAVSSHPSMNGLLEKIIMRLKEELGKLKVKINREKSKVVNLEKGKSIDFLGFTLRRIKNRNGKWGILTTPKISKRKELTDKIKTTVNKHRSTGVLILLIREINQILRGWVNYFRIGNSNRCFSYIRDYVEKKIRRFWMKQRGKKGYGWKRWSSSWLYDILGLYNDYKIRYYNCES
jgi:group II intron reverse transcriptase/maturase